MESAVGRENDVMFLLNMFKVFEIRREAKKMAENHRQILEVSYRKSSTELD